MPTMIDLFVVPICQNHKTLAFITTNKDQAKDTCFFHTKISTNDNSDKAAHQLISKYFDVTAITLAFHGIFQPTEVSENIALVYRLILNERPNNSALQLIDIDVRYDPSEIRTGLRKGSTDEKLGLSVIRYMHETFIRGIHSIKNTDGFEILISLLPETFDSTDLRIVYESLSGKPLRTVRMLANSMLDSYSIGSNKSGKEGRTVYGRNLIEEIPSEPDEDGQPIKEPAEFQLVKQKYDKQLVKQKYDKKGTRRTTLYRKKS